MSLRDLRNRVRRVERQREQSTAVTPPDWDALGHGDWSAFAASIGPPAPPLSSVLESQGHRLAQLCAELRCTLLDLGMPERPEDAGIACDHPPRTTSGFVECPGCGIDPDSPDL